MGGPLLFCSLVLNSLSSLIGDGTKPKRSASTQWWKTLQSYVLKTIYSHMFQTDKIRCNSKVKKNKMSSKFKKGIPDKLNFEVLGKVIFRDLFL